mgnify:CR=1 FL=1
MSKGQRQDENLQSPLILGTTCPSTPRLPTRDPIYSFFNFRHDQPCQLLFAIPRLECVEGHIIMTKVKDKKRILKAAKKGSCKKSLTRMSVDLKTESLQARGIGTKYSK